MTHRLNENYSQVLKYNLSSNHKYNLFLNLEKTCSVPRAFVDHMLPTETKIKVHNKHCMYTITKLLLRINKYRTQF